mmetsp:Transcript_76382/g.153363  ORF Transcript_76382/g.153363 Transcript_76382/m.153363 type:complete len:205 (-) Transcript_76382:256-870(-)
MSTMQESVAWKVRLAFTGSPLPRKAPTLAEHALLKPYIPQVKVMNKFSMAVCAARGTTPRDPAHKVTTRNCVCSSTGLMVAGKAWLKNTRTLAGCKASLKSQPPHALSCSLNSRHAYSQIAHAFAVAHTKVAKGAPTNPSPRTKHIEAAAAAAAAAVVAGRAGGAVVVAVGVSLSALSPAVELEESPGGSCSHHSARDSGTQTP